MDDYSDIADLKSNILDAFQEAYLALRKKFDIQPTGNIDFHLEDFELLKTYGNLSVKESFVIKNARTDCYILFTEISYPPLPSERYPTAHGSYQIWALAYLKHDFGRVLIRRETLADKIIELVHPIEIDFAEDKAFSDTFYVLANDFNKASANINRDFRNAVMDTRHDDFLIEIFDHTLIIGNKHTVTPEQATHLGDFVVRLCEGC